MRAGERGWIRKTPMQSLRLAGKDRAAFGAAFVAYCDHVGEPFAGFDSLGYGLSLLPRNINSDLAHRFDYQRIEFSRLQPGTVRFEIIAADFVEKGFRHLAAGAVVNTDEENLLFHNDDFFTYSKGSRR